MGDALTITYDLESKEVIINSHNKEEIGNRIIFETFNMNGQIEHRIESQKRLRIFSKTSPQSFSTIPSRAIVNGSAWLLFISSYKQHLLKVQKTNLDSQYQNFPIVNSNSN